MPFQVRRSIRCLRRSSWAPVWLAAAFLLFEIAACAQERRLAGTVLDSLGLPIAGATVEFQSAERSLSVTTEIEGTFEVPVSAPGFLVIRRPGFAPATVPVTAGDPADSFQVRLHPAPDIVRIVVTETGQQEERIPAVPSGQFVFSERQIDASGSQAVDDILRQAPGFSLFRRSSSLFANPTSQGVSMRGIGASGASRAAVLLDGVPLNDPFGGWVYFNQVPRAGIGSIQMSNGAASDVYGAGAMAGVINLTSRREEQSFGDAEISYGNRDTPFASFAGGIVTGPWTISLNGQAVRTHGYVLVPPDQRGLVDVRAGSGDLVASGEVAHRLGSRGRIFLGAASFGESKQNGTRVTNNDTRFTSFRAGADWEHPVAGAFSLRAYGSYEIFNQTFSAVAAGRNSETLTNRQRSPSQQVGFAGQWRRTFQARHGITAGSESRWVRGHSAETTFNVIAIPSVRSGISSIR